MPFQTIKLNDGRIIPQLGFGSAGKSLESLEDALNVGFDHIDTAQMYWNEEEVGKAIRESGLKRDNIWVTTKWSGRAATRPFQGIRQSLQKLGLEYVDLYLIHQAWLARPCVLETWQEMEDVFKDGLAKSIGVSNLNISDLQQIESAQITPAVNQILLHPYVYARTVPLIEYCGRRGIVIEAYSPLAPLTSHRGGPVDKPVGDIARRLGVEPEQVLLAWVKAKGAVILTSSSRRDRMERYMAVADIDLTEADVATIDEAGSRGFGFRYRAQKLVKPFLAGIAIQGAVYFAFKYSLSCGEV